MEGIVFLIPGMWPQRGHRPWKNTEYGKHIVSVDDQTKALLEGMLTVACIKPNILTSK